MELNDFEPIEEARSLGDQLDKAIRVIKMAKRVYALERYGGRNGNKTCGLFSEFANELNEYEEAYGQIKDNGW